MKRSSTLPFQTRPNAFAFMANWIFYRLPSASNRSWKLVTLELIHTSVIEEVNIVSISLFASLSRWFIVNAGHWMMFIASHKLHKPHWTDRNCRSLMENFSFFCRSFSNPFTSKNVIWNELYLGDQLVNWQHKEVLAAELNKYFSPLSAFPRASAQTYHSIRLHFKAENKKRSQLNNRLWDFFLRSESSERKANKSDVKMTF